MAGRKPKLSEAQLEYLVRLYTEERFTGAALSAFSGLSLNHLERTINRLGGSKQLQMEKAKLALEEHRAEFDALAPVEEKVEKIPKPRYKPEPLYNEAQWRWLGDRFTVDNFSAAEIAAFTGRSTSHVYKNLNRMGYHKKGGRRIEGTEPWPPLSDRKAEFNALADISEA